MTHMKYITLAGGRRLSYMEFGKGDGMPVFYFHGAPSSCLEPLLVGEEAFCRHGLRIIAPNRPGIGHSDFQVSRKFMDWPSDVISLADHLKLENFSLLGNSGGGPYVTACATRIPERLLSAVVVSGGWQMNLPQTRRYLQFPFNLFWIVTEKFPFLLPILLNAMRSPATEPREKRPKRPQRMMPLPDYQAIMDSNRLEVLEQAVNESLRSMRGVTWDLRLFVAAFGFSFSDITFPITFFHGEQDKNLPVELVRVHVGQIPNAKLITFKGEAHLSVLCNQFGRIAERIKTPNRME